MRTYFDHEKLDVYQLELQFITWVTPLIAKVRASLSALLTAEGNGRRQRRTRAKFFDDARGSAGECAACLDVLVAKNVCAAEEIDEGKQLLLRIASILTKLVDRFDSFASLSIIREEADAQGFEEEDEDKNEE